MAHKKFSTSKYLLNDLRSHKQQSQFRAGHEAYSLRNSQLKLRTNRHSVYYGSLTCGSLFHCQFQRAWAKRQVPSDFLSIIFRANNVFDLETGINISRFPALYVSAYFGLQTSI